MTFGPFHVSFKRATQLSYQLIQLYPLYYNKVEWCKNHCQDYWGWHFQSDPSFHPAYGKRTPDPTKNMAYPVMAFQNINDALKFKLAWM